MRFVYHFQNESYIPQLFARKFSPREPKCLNGVAVGDWDGLTTREIAPVGAISLLCWLNCVGKIKHFVME